MIRSNKNYPICSVLKVTRVAKQCNIKDTIHMRHISVTLYVLLMVDGSDSSNSIYHLFVPDS